MLKKVIQLTVICIAGLTLAAQVVNATAAEGTATQQQAEKNKRKHTGSMTERTYRKLATIHELIGEEKYTEALKLLDPLAKRLANDYERAIVYQTYGFVYASQDKLSRATDYLEKCIVLDALREDQTQRLVFNLAQLYIAQERYKEGVKTLENWFRTAESPDAHAYALLATAYAQGKEYRKAIPPLEKAIGMSDDPEETWYKLLMAMYYELKNYPKVADVLETLTSRWPENEKYWKQLSTIYIQLKRDQKALATLELAYSRGYLTKEREILQLANMHAYFADPFEAAQVLEKGIADGRVEASKKNLEMLGNYWMSAQENDKAIGALSRAGEEAENGKIDLRVAYLLIEKEQWKQAEKSLNKALRKGGLRKPGKAWLLLGMSAYETQRYDKAKQYFSKATAYEDSRKDANQWISHIESEQAILFEE
jgi:tetratricopeptide (TPR) repeat protein